ncbi:hypothetical protein NDU88_000415 [Pleurodeles waltl]|uniref:Uncharacterized protein n=1 Tax=Pleurodeles waltl TaxID=8319 RepID=A0AAV7NAA9_PLEWA|nr:hypothetical protein NDU88_000415 [Pleurodeles waltl]
MAETAPAVDVDAFQSPPLCPAAAEEEGTLFLYLHFLTFGDITSSPGCLSAPLLPEGQLELGHVCRLPSREQIHEHIK